jgi:hypothetical protein
VSSTRNYTPITNQILTNRPGITRLLALSLAPKSASRSRKNAANIGVAVETQTPASTAAKLAAVRIVMCLAEVPVPGCLDDNLSRGYFDRLAF